MHIVVFCYGQRGSVSNILGLHELQGLGYSPSLGGSDNIDNSEF